jgi:hypothetical protein
MNPDENVLDLVPPVTRRQAAVKALFDAVILPHAAIFKRHTCSMRGRKRWVISHLAIRPGRVFAFT